jgi:flavin-dependent dehydrogenase
MGYGGKLLRINFEDGFCPEYECFNIERDIFDQMLLREAKKGGTEVRQRTVKNITKLTDGDVRIETEEGELRGKYLLDASGQQTVVGKHLGTKKMVTDPDLKKVAYFSQFEGVERPPGREEGHPLIAMVDEGWFWMIPLNAKKTSVGIVLSADIAKRIMQEHSLKPDEMLQWAIERTPVVKERMKNAQGVFVNNVLADFSYHCRPYAGEGHFLIGDAAAFMDPIFSTGVSVAVNTSLAAAKFVDGILNGTIAPATARKKYIADLEESTGTLFKIIRQYYDHSFRELFIEGQGPMQVHKAVIGVLAGNVFPRPPFKMRWRLKLFDFFVKLNRKKQLVPRRRRFSLLKQTAQDNGPAPAALAG